MQIVTGKKFILIWRSGWHRDLCVILIIWVNVYSILRSKIWLLLLVWLLNDYFIWHWVLFFQNSISFNFSGEVQGGRFSSSTSICWDLPKLPNQNRAVHQLSEVWWWGDELGRCTWQRSINRRKKCTKLGTQACKGILASFV